MPPNSNTTPTPTRPMSVLRWLFVRFVIAALLLVLGFFGYRYVVVDQLNEQIRQRVETKFREHYRGLLVSVESARRIEGQGIEIRNLTIREVDRPTEPPLLLVERIFTSCNTALTDLVTQEPQATRVVLRRAHVHAVRRANGFWNVRNLWPPPKFGSCSPPVIFDDCTVKIFDESHPDRDPPEWRELQVALTPDHTAGEALGLDPQEAPRALKISGSMTGDHFREVRVDGAVDMASSRWHMRGEVDQLEFTPAMRAGLPQDLAKELAPIEAVSGNTHLRFDVHNLAGVDQPVQFRVTGDIGEGRIDDDRLPLPLTELSAKIFADNAGFKIDELTARLGAATINLSLHLEGYQSASPMVLRASATELALDERFTKTLPPDVLKLWNQLAPSGMLSGKLRVDFDGRNWRPEFDAQLEQLSFLYDKFPYRLFDGQATVKLVDDCLTFQGGARAGNSPVKFAAEFHSPGPNWHGWLEARSLSPLPIDDRLLAALTPQARTIVQSLSARGSTQLIGRLERREGTKLPAHLHLEAELCDVSVNYERFRYPIDRITGSLRGSDGVWSFVDLKGSQGTAQIQASGSYGPDGGAGPLLAMEFRATDVPLDENLRRALPADQQKLWNDFRPRGELDLLGVNLSYRPQQQKFTLEIDGQKLSPNSAAVQRTIRLEPVWFPYAMEVTAGSVRYREGVLELAKIRALHGKTKLEADGECRWSGENGWSLALDRLCADRLQLDHDLLAALPTDLGSALAKAKFSGNLGMTGVLKLAARNAETPLDAAWDLNFDVEEGRLGGETPVDHIQGSVHVVGGVEQGRWSSRGQLEFDSLFVRNAQITRLLGPFYLDARQLLLGSWAKAEQKDIPAPQLTAQVFEGLLKTDAAVSLEDDGKFTLASTLEDASLARLMQECGTSHSDITGKTFGVLQMTGTTRGKHTWRGGGNIRLREANLYKLPQTLALLKVLSVRSPNDTAFTTSDIDFRMQGDDVVFDRIELAGDAITLKGRGQLFEQKQVDLLFYTQVGRRDIQALRPLMAEASPNFLLIEVSGTIDNPSVVKTAFPAINGTLRELFSRFGARR